MKNSSFLNNFLFICFIFSFITLISHSTNAAHDHNHDNEDLIANVCTGNPACLTLIRGEPKASSAKNYLDLAKIILEMCIRKSTESQNFIKALLKTKENPSIRRCAFESYGAVVGSFTSAFRELDEDIQTANYDSMIAGDDARECQTELESHGIQSPEIFSRNTNTILLSNIAAKVTDLAGA